MRILPRRKEKDPAPARAILDAEENLQVVKDRAVEVSAVAKETRDLRVRNHFAEQLEGMLSGKPKGRLS